MINLHLNLYFTIIIGEHGLYPSKLKYKSKYATWTRFSQQPNITTMKSISMIQSVWDFTSTTKPKHQQIQEMMAKSLMTNRILAKVA